ncbi:DUF485 domain-containing protein [Streptomyces sp. NPDC050704]|uniref:DUF485 domain-containing protein n=1 Tax=Streptomyces sp. NPDC050704 TaxID=3157219 RepID=UPI0034225945
MPRHNSPHYGSPSDRTPSAPEPRSAIGSHPDFRSIRGAHRTFGVVALSVSVGGFLLFVLLSSFLPDVLNQPLFGHVTLGLAVGVGQFAVMAVTAWRYTVHMDRRIDPAADRLRAQLHRDEAQRARVPQQQRRFGAW